MSALATIPILKDIIGWLRNTELVEHLKSENKYLRGELEQCRKDHKAEIKAIEKGYKQEISKYKRRLKINEKH